MPFLSMTGLACCRTQKTKLQSLASVLPGLSPGHVVNKHLHPAMDHVGGLIPDHFQRPEEYLMKLATVIKYLQGTLLNNILVVDKRQR